MYDLKEFEVNQDLFGDFAWKKAKHICLGIHLKQFFTIFFGFPTDGEDQSFTQHYYQCELGDINST